MWWSNKRLGGSVLILKNNKRSVIGRDYWHGGRADISNLVNTVEPRYLELAYFEFPLISKWKSGPCFNMKLWQQITKIMGKRGEIAISPLFNIIIYIYF